MPKTRKSRPARSSAPRNPFRFNTERDLEDLASNTALGAERVKEILDYLESHPDAHVLEVGCGDGNALRDLKRDFPIATFYGMDINKPKDTAGFIFLHGSVEDQASFADHKFDRVFSAAVFPYVKRKRKAFRNVAGCLNDDGRAYIHVEPLSVGPNAIALVQRPGVIEWTKDQRAVIIFPSDGTEIMPDATYYEYPEELKLSFYRDNRYKDGIFHLPAITPSRIIKELKRTSMPWLGKKIEGAEGVNWKLLPFLEFRTDNTTRGEGAGKGAQPYHLAATSVYMRSESMSNKVLGRCLLERSFWDRQTTKEPHTSMLDEDIRDTKQLLRLTQKESAHCLVERSLNRYRLSSPYEMLLAAIDSDDTGTVKLSSLAHPELFLRQNDEGDTPLHIALRARKFRLFHVMKAVCGRKDIENHKGETVASMLGKLDCYGKTQLVAEACSSSSFWKPAVVVGLAAAGAAVAYYAMTSDEPIEVEDSSFAGIV